jgi:hypothetical protein
MVMKGCNRRNGLKGASSLPEICPGKPQGCGRDIQNDPNVKAIALTSQHKYIVGQLYDCGKNGRKHVWLRCGQGGSVEYPDRELTSWMPLCRECVLSYEW